MDINNLSNDGLTQEELYQMMIYHQSSSKDIDSNNDPDKSKYINTDDSKDNIDSTDNDRRDQNSNTKKKKSSKRCQFGDCKRKLGILSDVICKCGLKTCSKHRFFTDHNCQFDYKSENSKKIAQHNPQIVKKKLQKIDDDE